MIPCTSVLYHVDMICPLLRVVPTVKPFLTWIQHSVVAFAQNDQENPARPGSSILDPRPPEKDNSERDKAISYQYLDLNTAPPHRGMRGPMM